MMRTTIVFDDFISIKIKALAAQKKLSEFINARLHEYFIELDRKKKFKELGKAYARAAKEDNNELDILDTEGWPEW